MEKEEKKGEKEDIGINDEISKETLISLLKEKSREIKNLTTKLSKLEGKYVKVFKENKIFSKDRDTFY